MLVRTSNFSVHASRQQPTLNSDRKTLCHFCTILLFHSLSACQRHAPWKFLRNCLTYNFLICWVKGTKSNRCISPGDAYKRRQFSESCNLIFSLAPYSNRMKLCRGLLSIETDIYLADSNVHWRLTQTYCALAFTYKLCKHTANVFYQLQHNYQQQFHFKTLHTTLH